MTALTIPANEQGRVRVFALDMPAEQLRFLHENDSAGDTLGGVQLDLDYVDIFPVSDLGDLGLPGYLTEGCGVPAAELAPDRARLGALTGHVMILLSRAFAGRATTLPPSDNLTLIATYTVPATDWSARPMNTTLTPRISPRATRVSARRTGAIIFTAFMVILVVVILLVAL
jgi:hypothetical protein